LKEKKAESIALFEKVKPVVQEKKAVPTTQPDDLVLSREEQKEREKQKKKLESQLQKCEREIERLERAIAAMDIEIAQLDYTDAAASKKKLDAYAPLKAELEAVMLQWEETGTILSGF
jgi:ATP-binding cassette subfamily F protein 3